jgi:hypothetical protein
VSEVRWEGRSHQEIYDAVMRGPGAAISTPAVDAWTRTAALIERIDQRITAAITGSQAAWEGSAADATRSAMTPLGQWALDAANDAKITASAVQTQAEQAQKLRADMPPPLTAQRNAEMERALTDPTYIFHGLDDLQAIEEKAANDAARAVDLMTRDTNDSYENRRNMDFWTLPPQVTVVTDAAPAGPGGTPGAPAVPGGPAPTPPADVATPPPGGAAPVPPAGSPPPVVPPGPPTGAPPGTPGVPPAGPPIAQAPAGPIPPAVVPPVPGPGGLPPAPGPGGAPPVPTGPTGPGSTPAPAITPPSANPVVPPIGPGAVPPARPTTAPSGVQRPVVPGPPRTAPPPSWRDVIPAGPTPPGSRFPGPGAADPNQALPPGPRSTSEPLGTRAVAEPTAARTAAAGPTPGLRGPGPSAMGGLYPPMAAGLGGGQERERRRPDYLLDDSGAFVDDRWFTPAVITPDDGPPVRR